MVGLAPTISENQRSLVLRFSGLRFATPENDALFAPPNILAKAPLQIF